MKDNRKSDKILTDMGNDMIDFYNYLDYIFKDFKSDIIKEKK